MNKKSKLLYDGIILLGVVLIGYFGVKFYGYYTDREESNQLYKKLNEQYVSVPEQSGAYEEEPDSPPEEDSYEGSVSGGEALADETPEIKEIAWHDMIRVDFESLKELNGDVVGWIFFENEDISYPILYSGDNVNIYAGHWKGKVLLQAAFFWRGPIRPILRTAEPWFTDIT